VAWPNRSEVINYTTVTFATLVALIFLIFILNYAFGKGVFWLFNT
jgi:preprotein translocase subunit SecE